MYNGKMTKELEKLYKEYENKFGVEPDYYEDVEYGKNDYKKYINDIAKSIKLNIQLPNLYPNDEDDF